MYMRRSDIFIIAHMSTQIMQHAIKWFMLAFEIRIKHSSSVSRVVTHRRMRSRWAVMTCRWMIFRRQENLCFRVVHSGRRDFCPA